MRIPSQFILVRRPFDIQLSWFQCGGLVTEHIDGFDQAGINRQQLGGCSIYAHVFFKRRKTPTGFLLAPNKRPATPSATCCCAEAITLLPSPRTCKQRPCPGYRSLPTAHQTITYGIGSCRIESTFPSVHACRGISSKYPMARQH